MKKFWSIGFVLGTVFAVGLFSLIGKAIAATYMSQDVNYPIYIDNVMFVPSTPAQNVQGSTYLPLRAMSEALGVQIEWDATARRVDVYKNLTPETKNVPDIIMWDYIKEKSNNLLSLQSSSATTFALYEDNDEYAIQLLYYDGKTTLSPGSQLKAKLNVNFTNGTFELMYIGTENVENYKGNFDNDFNATNITKDNGSESTCKDFVKEKLDEYRKYFLNDSWNLKLVGLRPSEMKTKKLLEYVK